MSDNFESDEIQALNLPVNNFFLNTARTKDWVEITQMRVDKDTFSYLQNLGLKPGTAAEIISQTASGSVVVRLNRQQIGLGADIARRLIVTFTNKQDNEN
ncbi:FeoA family protein [Myxosarcina sp. GI1]|uniref:FeoA family protein n=1 Tax=Myxosarcina sp. GI1 TaxID=1541065 RepID=UPI00155ACA30|nr:FeoA family protein [Myxosarcina sp. GI1]